jgi:hypothetical protein
MTAKKKPSSKSDKVTKSIINEDVTEDVVVEETNGTEETDETDETDESTFTPLPVAPPPEIPSNNNNDPTQTPNNNTGNIPTIPPVNNPNLPTNPGVTPQDPTKPRSQFFYLQRNVDVSGVSVVGIVAEGVVFPNGRVGMTWLSKTPSVTVHNEILAAQFVHSHGGNTEFIFSLRENAKHYYLNHEANVSGLSGVGKVGELTLFNNGFVAYQWLVFPYQIEYFITLADFEAVHVNPNSTLIEY